MDINTTELINMAMAALNNAYTPYSQRPNGAAILTKEGKVFTGSSVEIANFSSSVCAVKVALVKACSEGERSFAALAVAGSGVDSPYPCGDCLQALMEFSPEILIISEFYPNKLVRLQDLLPFAFLFT